MVILLHKGQLLSEYFAFSELDYVVSRIFEDIYIYIAFICCSGLTESLYLPHKDTYIECEQASLRQLYKLKVYHNC